MVFRGGRQHPFRTFVIGGHRSSFAHYEGGFSSGFQPKSWEANSGRKTTGVGEIKDKIRVRFDKQSQAQFDYSVNGKLSYNIVTSPRTRYVTVELQQRVRQRGGIIVEFDDVSGSFKSVRFGGTRGSRVIR
jgi:hypothetical protein